MIINNNIFNIIVTKITLNNWKNNITQVNQDYKNRLYRVRDDMIMYQMIDILPLPFNFRNPSKNCYTIQRIRLNKDLFYAEYYPMPEKYGFSSGSYNKSGYKKN